MTRILHPSTACLRVPMAVVMISLFACGSPSNSDKPVTSVVPDTAFLSTESMQLAAFTVDSATVQPWREAWAAPAQIALDPKTTQMLGAIAEGRITRVTARVGDRVRKGDLLVAIHSHEMMSAQSDLLKAQAARSEAKSALALATSNVARAERLYSLKALSLADLEKTRALQQQAATTDAEADAELARAQGMVEHLVGSDRASTFGDDHEVLVRSPIDGVVVASEAQLGSVVLIGAPLVAVGDPSSLLLIVQLPEQALSVARVGSTVRFSLAAFPANRMEAAVVRVAPTLASLTRTVEVQARVPRTATNARAEMYATAELLGPSGAPALSIPATAIQTIDGDTVAITARTKQGGLQIEAVRVRVGRRTSDRAEIIAGLKAGEHVIVGDAAIARAELLRRRGER